MTDSQKQLAGLVLGISGLAALGYALFTFQKDGQPAVDYVKNGKMWGIGLGLWSLSYLVYPGQFNSKITFNNK